MNPLVNDLLRQLADRRKEVGMSARDLAEKVRVNRQTVAKAESGEVPPSLRILTAMADELGCDVRIVPRDGAA